MRSVKFKDSSYPHVVISVDQSESKDSKFPSQQKLNIPEFVVKENQFLKNFDAINKKLNEFPILSFDGYNKILKYLNEIQRIAINQVIDRNSKISEIVFKNSELDSAKIDSILMESKEKSINTINNIIVYLNQKSFFIENLLFDFKNTNTWSKMVSDFQNDFFDENESMTQLIDIHKNLNEKIIEKYTPFYDVMNNILNKLDEYEHLVNK